MRTGSRLRLLAVTLFAALLFCPLPEAQAQNPEAQRALDALDSVMDSMNAPKTAGQKSAQPATTRRQPSPTNTAAPAKQSCYSNSKFHYALCYPQGALIGKGESDSGDGQRFVSPDKKVVLLAWGFANYNNETVQQNYASMQNDVDFRVTYKRQSGDWFVLSGVDYKGVVYLKRWVRDNFIVTLQMHYPQSLKDRVDPLLKQVFDSVSLW